MSAELPIVFDADGLVPAVVQDIETGDVLMLAYMNREALERTFETGQAHFWSRSRQTLWRKGETSGHVQLVREIRVNCYENSLLLSVTQVGACCHTGYPTCYFRRLDPNGSLTVVAERAFDPTDVYGQSPDTSELRLWFGAYEYLRDTDLAAVSATSRALRSGDADLTGRLADELEELAGVLRGEHVHTTPVEDAILEASQALYWLTLAALRSGHRYEDLGLDMAVAPSPTPVQRDAAARHLDGMARAWRRGISSDFGPTGTETTRVIAAALTGVGARLEEAIAFDLAALREKPYLAPYFTAATPPARS
jgi:phosphoribosyl-AMP cyclohydrolase